MTGPMGWAEPWGAGAEKDREGMGVRLWPPTGAGMGMRALAGVGVARSPSEGERSAFAEASGMGSSLAEYRYETAARVSEARNNRD